jgi:Golgi phosphoprotein 3 (GPP34)
VILEGQREAPRLVGSQLEAARWLRAQPRRVLGIVPATRLRLQDEEMVDGLAVPVTTVLRNAIDGWPADERLVALGLLCVFGQLPAVLSFDEAERHRPELEEMAAAIPPITGMDEAIQIVHGAMTRNYYKSAPYAN